MTIHIVEVQAIGPTAKSVAMELIGDADVLERRSKQVSVEVLIEAGEGISTDVCNDSNIVLFQ